MKFKTLAGGAFVAVFLFANHAWPDADEQPNVTKTHKSPKAAASHGSPDKSGPAGEAETQRSNVTDALPQLMNRNGITTVVLGTALQVQAGIKTLVLTSRTYHASFSAYGAVLDPTPLLTLHANYVAGEAQIAIDKAEANAAKANYGRLSLLNRDDRNISTQNLQTSEAIYLGDQSKLAAARADLTNLRLMALSQWGNVIATSILEKIGEPFSNLFNGKKALLQVTLPPGKSLSSPPAVIQVETGGVMPNPDARFVSASPQGDPSIQGETFFYVMPARNVRIGMQLIVRVPLQHRAARGVVVPRSAVLSYGNRDWVYLRTDEDHFVRHLIAAKNRTPGGWFETDLRPGQQVVVQGAQLLLSQELGGSSAKADNDGDADSDGDHEAKKKAASHGSDGDSDGD